MMLPHEDNGPVARALGLAVRQLMALPCPKIIGCADATDLLGRRDLLQAIAKIIDPVLYEIMSECAENSNDVSRDYYCSILSDAFEDRSVLSTLEVAAEKLAEEAGEAAERPLRECFAPDARRRVSVD